MGSIGSDKPVHKPEIAFTRRIAQGAIMIPIKDAPPTVFVWAFFSMMRARILADGTLADSTAMKIAVVMPAGMEREPSESQEIL